MLSENVHFCKQQTLFWSTEISTQTNGYCKNCEIDCKNEIVSQTYYEGTLI